MNTNNQNQKSNYRNNNQNTKTRNPKKRKQESSSPSISPIKRIMYIVFWLTILIMSGGLIINQASQYNELRRELAAVQADIEHEIFIYKDLQLRLTLFDSDAYIMMLAQERLGMVFPWEVVFINNLY